MVSDAQLIKESLGGNTQAFGALVERYKQLACAVAYSSTGNPAASEEIAQEAFVVAWRNLSRLEMPGKLRPWLAAIIRNIAKDWLRRNWREGRRIEALKHVAASRPPETPLEAALALERNNTVWQAIEGLPEAYRVALILYYREEMSVQKVADALELTPDAARQRLSRGRAMVREQLASLVEDTLRNTGPKKNFTAGVLVALPPLVVPPSGTPAYALPHTVSGSWLSSGNLVAGFSGMAAIAILAALAWVQLRPEEPAGSLPVVNASVRSVETPGPAPDAAPIETEPAATPPVSAPEAAPPRESADSFALPPVYVVPAGYPGTDPASAPSDTVMGTVYDSQGRPAPGAAVWAARFGFGMRDTHEAQTDANGHFELRVPQGSWRLQARRDAEGAEAPIRPHGIFIAGGKGGSQQVDVKMSPRGWVHGQVLETETGQPIPRARLWTDSDFVVEADDEGRYSIEGVTPGAHCLWAAAPGRERRYVQYCTLSRPQSELDIGLSRAGKVTGRVVTEDGRPIAYAWIEKPMSHWGAGNGLFEMCDEQGRFEYDGLELGKEVTLHARIPVYHAACGDPYPAWKQAGVCQSLTCRVREGGETPELTYVLKAAPANGDVTPWDWPETVYLGAVSGIVTSESGQPVRSFRVLLQRPRTDAYASGFASTLEINSWDKGFAFTSDDGTFTLTTRELEPGKYVRVSVVADGYGDAIQDTVLVQPLDRPGGIPPLLFRLPPPAQLMVRVLDTWGNAVPGAHVTLLDPISQRQHRDWIDGRLTGARSVERETVEDGTVRFDNLGMTSGDIAVCKEGYAFARAIWRGEPVVNFELQPPCSVEGVLFDAWERPLRDGYITLLRSDAETWDYFSSEDDSYQRVVVPADAGRVQIGNLPPGRYTLKVDAKQGMVQIGIDPNGEPVTVVPADSHLFYQEITLEQGDAYLFTCPDDSAHLNPEPWQTVGITPDDQVVRSSMTGTWVSANRLPNGNAIYGIEHFGRDGSYDRYSYTVNSIPFEESGYFKVSGGLLWQLSDTAGLIYSECVLSADGKALKLKAVGSDFSNTYHRAQDLDAARAEAVALVGPPPPMPYTPIDPIPVDTDPGIGTFGWAGEY